MKLVRFTHEDSTRVGLVDGEEVVDLAAARPSLPTDMVPFLEAGEPALQAAREAAGEKGARIPLARVRLEAPVERPPKFLAIGLNYGDHIEESGQLFLLAVACEQHIIAGRSIVYCEGGRVQETSPTRRSDV